jgi:hypothetical protein
MDYEMQRTTLQLHRQLPLARPRQHTRLRHAEAAFTAVCRVAQHLQVGSPGLRLQLLDALVMSRLLFAAVTWSPVAPAAPVIVPSQCESMHGAHAVWPQIEVAHRKWLRWALQVDWTD